MTTPPENSFSFVGDETPISLPQLPAEAVLSAVSEEIYARVMRRDLAAPGYALIALRGASAPVSLPASRCSVPRPPLGASSSETPDRVESLSLTLRAAMLDLKEALSAIHLARTGQRLGYLSLARFDQQVTTRFHVDGAPPGPT